jgi:mRNA-degrading endonuclease toxin of MazEF toxin-antitoxin module
MTVETQYPVSTGVEPFYHYALSWPGTETRTDTPDLMGAFSRLEDEILMAEGSAWAAEENRAIHSDLASTSFKTFPAE